MKQSIKEVNQPTQHVRHSNFFFRMKHEGCGSDIDPWGTPGVLWPRRHTHTFWDRPTHTNTQAERHTDRGTQWLTQKANKDPGIRSCIRTMKCCQWSWNTINYSNNHGGSKLRNVLVSYIRCVFLVSGVLVYIQFNCDCYLITGNINIIGWLPETCDRNKGVGFLSKLGKGLHDVKARWLLKYPCFCNLVLISYVNLYRSKWRRLIDTAV